VPLDLQAHNHSVTEQQSTRLLAGDNCFKFAENQAGAWPEMARMVAICACSWQESMLPAAVDAHELMGRMVRTAANI
jgi:hypothetical protein